MNNFELNEKENKLNGYLGKIKSNLMTSLISIKLMKTISEAKDEISSNNFGSFLFGIQRILISDIILSVNKIFEDNKDNKSVSLKKIINYINSEQRSLRMQQNSISTLEKYKHFDFSNLRSKKLECIQELPWTKEYQGIFEKNKNGLLELRDKYYGFELKPFMKIIQNSIESIYEIYKLDINALKEIRDRNIAHNDIRSIENKTTWDKIDELIDFVKEFIDLLDFVFFSTYHSSDNGKSFEMLDNDSKRVSRNMLSLLKKAEVIDNYKKYDKYC